jgi:hypothetical protein
MTGGHSANSAYFKGIEDEIGGGAAFLYAVVEKEKRLRLIPALPSVSRLALKLSSAGITLGDAATIL